MIEHYCEQYDHMCRLVVQRARGQPTAVIAGDVHHYALYTAGQGSLLQIVSSPIVMRGRAHRSDNPFAFPDLGENSKGWHRGGRGARSSWISSHRAIARAVWFGWTSI